jgi:hypothetical protein
MYNKFIRLMGACLIAMSVSLATLAQDDELGEENGDPGDGDGSVPVDGGVSLLFAAGAAYAVIRLRSVKNKERSQVEL